MLAALSDTDFDSAVYDLALHSNPGSFADAYIGSLINALAKSISLRGVVIEVTRAPSTRTETAGASPS